MKAVESWLVRLVPGGSSSPVVRTVLVLLLGAVLLALGVALLAQGQLGAAVGLLVLGCLGGLLYRLWCLHEHLAEVQAQTQAILDTAADGILAVDEAGHLRS